MGPVLLLASSAAAAAASAAPAAEVRRIPAAEARQGVASDGTYIYAVDDSRIGKYRIADGVRVAQWTGDPALFPHLNSCSIERRELVCASSNYPALPQTGSVEYFDAATLRHLRSRKLGETDGSLTALDFHNGSWWAVFAQYDGKGGAPGKDHRSTRVVRYDRAFRPRAQWLLPPQLLERIRPYSISGASWGPGGRLALSGHDRPEIYLVSLPANEPLLRLERVRPVATRGQAIAYDPKRRHGLWSISRSEKTAVLSDLR